MTTLQASRMNLRALSILSLSLACSFVLVLGMGAAAPSRAQSPARTDAAKAAEARPDGTSKKSAANPWSPLTYDQLGATPAAKLPKKSGPRKTPPAQTVQEKKAPTQESRAKP